MRFRRGGYAITNLVIVLIVCIFLSIYFLHDTSLFYGSTLFEQEEENFEPYINETFTNYDEFSEALDSGREDLSRWQQGGAITAFTEVADWETIEKVNLKLTDGNGKTVVLEGIENLSIPRENNQIKSDDPFPNPLVGCSDQNLNTWEDFMLVNGSNLLFWTYNVLMPVDMSNIVAWEAYDGENVNEKIPLTNVVIHDGLCQTKNSLNGQWYTPNGVPQYGVWWPEDGELIVKKVRQTQYPSNGDHARILSVKDTPPNFLMRTKFTVRNLGDNLYNTYVRIGWDFDNEYDPGHDQTLIYNSLQYGYLGVQRVYPIERYFTQGYEPDQSDMAAKTEFKFKNNHTYEIDAKVEGQNVVVEVYDIGLLFDRKVATLNYTFTTPRQAKPYPFSIEETGNIDLVIDEVEIKTE